MREVPLEVILSFPIPNYENPPTRGNSIVIVNAIFITLVCLSVLLRLHARICIKRWFGLDDAFIIAATIFAIGLTVCVILANTKYGWGRHVWDVPLDLIPGSSQIAYVAKILYTLASSLTRISLLCFYYRLVHDSGIRWITMALHATMAFNIGILITFLGLAIFLCTPIEAYWVYPKMDGATCLDEGYVAFVAGIINCCADLLVTILPIPFVVKLNLPDRQRLGVVVLLSLGLIVTVAGAIRTYFIWMALVATYDETWFSYPFWIATAIEIDLGILCACAPALRPVAARCIGGTICSLPDKVSSMLTNSTYSQKNGSIHHAPLNTYRTLNNNSVSLPTTYHFPLSREISDADRKRTEARSYELSRYNSAKSPPGSSRGFCSRPYDPTKAQTDTNTTRVVLHDLGGLIQPNPATPLPPPAVYGRNNSMERTEAFGSNISRPTPNLAYSGSIRSLRGGLGNNVGIGVPLHAPCPTSPPEAPIKSLGSVPLGGMMFPKERGSGMSSRDPDDKLDLWLHSPEAATFFEKKKEVDRNWSDARSRAGSTSTAGRGGPTSWPEQNPNTNSYVFPTVTQVRASSGVAEPILPTPPPSTAQSRNRSKSSISQSSRPETPPVPEWNFPFANVGLRGEGTRGGREELSVSSSEPEEDRRKRKSVGVGKSVREKRGKGAKGLGM